MIRPRKARRYWRRPSAARAFTPAPSRALEDPLIAKEGIERHEAYKLERLSADRAGSCLHCWHPLRAGAQRQTVAQRCRRARGLLFAYEDRAALLGQRQYVQAERFAKTTISGRAPQLQQSRRRGAETVSGRPQRKGSSVGD